MWQLSYTHTACLATTEFLLTGSRWIPPSTGATGPYQIHPDQQRHRLRLVHHHLKQRWDALVRQVLVCA